MDEEDPTLLARARACDDCLCWLAVCEAECCSGIRFRLKPDSDVTRVAGGYRIGVRMDEDLCRYFLLHGLRVEGDAVEVPEEACTLLPEALQVTVRCNALRDDGLCRLHPDGKPEGCKELSWDTARQDSHWLTPRCLFTYKLRAESRDR